MAMKIFFIVCLAVIAVASAAIVTGEIPQSKLVPSLKNTGVIYCPNNCSYPQGECVEDDGCICQPGFAAVDCSAEIKHLDLNTKSDILTLDGGKWAIFEIQVTDEYIQLMVEMRSLASKGDPDLFLRFGQPPIEGVYDYADFRIGPDSFVEVCRGDVCPTGGKDLKSGTYYIGVYAYGSDQAVFQVEPLAYSCPNDCSAPNGDCNPTTHQCTCKPGWTLSDCSASSSQLGNPWDSRHGSLLPMQWVYYSLNVSQKQEFNDVDWAVRVLRDQSDRFGFMDVYVNPFLPPSLDTYMYASARNSFNNTIKVCSSSLMAGQWYVGLYNWGFEALNYTLQSRLIATCPNNCAGHGICHHDGTCECNAGYLGADCSVNRDDILAGSVSGGAVVGISLLMILIGVVIALVVNHYFGARIAAKFRQLRGVSSSVQGDDTPAPSGTYSTFA